MQHRDIKNKTAAIHRKSSGVIQACGETGVVLLLPTFRKTWKKRTVPDTHYSNNMKEQR